MFWGFSGQTNCRSFLKSCMEDPSAQSTKFHECFSSNCVSRDDYSRSGWLRLAPMYLASTLIDTTLGVGAGVASILTLRKYSKLNKVSEDMLSSSSFIISGPALLLLCTLNPRAKFEPKNDKNPSSPLIGVMGGGFVADYVRKELSTVAKNCWESEDPLKKHVGTRLTHALILVTAVAARVVDLVIGLLAFVAALLTFGKVITLNNLAYRGLQAPGLIEDVFKGLSNVINPPAD